MQPSGMLIVIPSRLGVGEPFELKVKLLGPVQVVPSFGGALNPKPRPRGPYNLNPSRGIQYLDSCLGQWRGRLRLDAPNLDGPDQIVFDGCSQGVFPGDRRPILTVSGLRWKAPDIQFLRLIDTDSGLEAWSNPTCVTEQPPTERIWWGDPHWQTFFSDGIRCPEELYAFARDEAFLDFGAISDHMEAVTDRQWDYFQAVTDDANEPGRFVTLHGQEWTNHDPSVGAPGHRNIYFRRKGAPPLRSTDGDCNTLEKLWRLLDALPAGEAIVVPHHSANTVMGVDWSLGWNPRYEKAVEIYSVWGNSERPAEQGNPRPIRSLDGEMPGRHVIDALKRGYRFGFLGGGDIHDGRPGDDLHTEQSDVAGYQEHLWPQGFTAAMASGLTRDAVFDAIGNRATYATTRSRIYLEVSPSVGQRAATLAVRAASEDGLREVTLIRNGDDLQSAAGGTDSRIAEVQFALGEMAAEEFCYVRAVTEAGNMAWSSPLWGDDLQ